MGGIEEWLERHGREFSQLTGFEEREVVKELERQVAEDVPRLNDSATEEQIREMIVNGEAALSLRERDLTSALMRHGGVGVAPIQAFANLFYTERGLAKARLLLDDYPRKRAAALAAEAAAEEARRLDRLPMKERVEMRVREELAKRGIKL